MTENKLYLDIHAVQTLPPSNVNRDDTGSPKTAQYGGVTRARVSSQSWKRAMREYFADKGSLGNIGVRTTKLSEYIKDKIMFIDETIDEDDALNLAINALNISGISMKNDKASALFFISEKQAENVARMCLSGDLDNKDKKDLKEELASILNTDPSLDLILFGRMVASTKDLNFDAVCQVAHSISTHEIDEEYDYYIALDDLDEDQQGANMLGTIEFNSSTLYRYSDVAVHNLYEGINDRDNFKNALRLFVEGFIKSMPSGMSNSFANQTLPQAVIVTLREDRPLNLVSAFEDPIISKKGYVKESIKHLFEEHDKYKNMLNTPIATSYFILDDIDDLCDIGDREKSVDSLIENITEQVDRYFNN